MVKNALFAALLFVSAPAFAAVEYSAVIDDLPLMSGMAEETEDALVFDDATGRIVDTYAVTTAERAAVLAFYDAALPPLGWTKSAGASYVRDGERLKISFEGKNLVRFSITPEGK